MLPTPFLDIEHMEICCVRACSNAETIKRSNVLFSVADVRNMSTAVAHTCK